MEFLSGIAFKSEFDIGNLASCFAFLVASLAAFVAAKNLKQATIARQANTINHIFGHISSDDNREARRKLLDPVIGDEHLNDKELRKLISSYDRCALIVADDDVLKARLLNFQADALHRIMTKHRDFVERRRETGHMDYARHLDELWEWGKRNRGYKKGWNSSWPNSDG